MLNGTSVSLNWSAIYPEHVHGVFQGYKILYRITENSSYTEYISVTQYANYTEKILTGLEIMTNYTLRVLSFSLSGDGLIGDPVTVLTPDGEGMYFFHHFLNSIAVHSQKRTSCSKSPITEIRMCSHRLLRLADNKYVPSC